MHHQEEVLTTELFKDKKILALSDTGYPYQHIRNFCKLIKDSIVDVYVSPATTSGFLKVYASATGNRRVKILKDKNYQIFNKNFLDKYIVVIFFGSKITKETKLLTIIAQQLIIQNKNVIVVSEEGIDYDEDNSIFR